MVACLAAGVRLRHGPAGLAAGSSLGSGRYVVDVRLWGKGKRSGAEVDQRFAYLYTLRAEDEKIIRAQLTPGGYKEFSRAALLEPTFPFGGRNVAWPPPAYANRHVFARNDKELICASLAAKP